MSAAPNKTNISFKVELKRKEDQSSFHRFTGAYSFSELNTVVSHLWGERPKHLQLDYTDDEGDQVRFTSEAEWDECVRIHLASLAPVLRLTGRRVKEPKQAKSKQEKKNETKDRVALSDSSDSEEVDVADLRDISVVDDVHLKAQSGVWQPPAAVTATTAAVMSAGQQLAEVTASASSRFSTECASVLNTLPQVAREVQKPLNLEPLSKTASDLLQATLFTVKTPPSSTAGSCEPASQPASMGARSAPASAPAPVPVNVEEENDAKTPAPPLPKVECDASTAVVDLMSQLYKCDANAELFIKGATEQFASVVKRLVNPFAPNEINLEINREKLYRDVVAEGNRMIGSAQLEEAGKLLKTATSVFPDDCLIEYNLACVHSLANKCLGDAIDLLVAAKKHGYTNEGHLKTDADLANARKHPRWTDVVPAPPVNPDVMTLLSVFPELSLDEATNALKRAEGNLTRAVNARLTGF